MDLNFCKELIAMMLCPKCKSDTVERTSSTGARVIVCIILLFIPFGFLFCWIPFVFPHTYKCNVCGNEGKEEELLNVDWRERDDLMKEYENLGQKLYLLEDKWIKNQHSNLCKIVKTSGKVYLLELTESNNIGTYRILHYIEGEDLNTVIVKNISEDFSVMAKGEDNILFLTSFGKELITLEEFEEIVSGSFVQWMENQQDNIEQIEVKVGA
jgi:hypothetical protein